MLMWLIESRRPQRVLMLVRLRLALRPRPTPILLLPLINPATSHTTRKLSAVYVTGKLEGVHRLGKRDRQWMRRSPIPFPASAKPQATPWWKRQRTTLASSPGDQSHVAIMFLKKTLGSDEYGSYQHTYSYSIQSLFLRHGLISLKIISKIRNCPCSNLVALEIANLLPQSLASSLQC